VTSSLSTSVEENGIVSVLGDGTLKSTSFARPKSPNKI